MIDPTGIGAAIFGAIRLAYWGLALTCLGLAISLPKTRRTKVILSLLVVGVFVGLPTLFAAKQQAERNSRRDAMQAACLTSNLVSNEMSPAPGFYAGSGALILVDGRSGKEQLKKYPGFADIANYLVERKMSFLELDTPTPTSSLRHELGWGNVPGIEHPYLRVSVAPLGTPECAASAKWSTESPALRIPKLRRSGLMPEHCIAVEGVSELRSRYRITAKIAPAVIDHETRAGLWERKLEVRDSTSAAVVATFRLFIVEGDYNNHWIGCGKGDEARRFEQIVPISPDPRFIQLREVTDEEPVDFPVRKSATSEDIQRISKVGGLDKIYPLQVISDDGKVWFESSYKTDSSRPFKQQGYFLTMVVNGELRRTLVRIDGLSMDWVTGFQVTGSSVRFVARNDSKAVSWLVEYSRNGAPVRALALTEDQVATLKRD